MKSYEKALQIAPTDAEAWNGLILSYCEKRNVAKAQEAIAKARELGVQIRPDVIDRLRSASSKPKK